MVAPMNDSPLMRVLDGLADLHKQLKPILSLRNSHEFYKERISCVLVSTFRGGFEPKSAKQSAQRAGSLASLPHDE